jgi:inosine-uridine nucleoside N-ribohydrolase
MRPLAYAVACVAALAFAPPALAAPKKVPVVIDTDIGADIDDAFALALAVASPELDVLGVTTVGRGPVRDPYVQHVGKESDEDRAWLVCRFLTQVGVKSVPVAAGADPQPKSPVDWQIQYRRHPAAIYNRTLKPVKESAAELMARLAKERGEITIIALGPLTNVARMLKDHPDAAKHVSRVVLMGGSVAVGYDGKPQAEPEWNIKSDVPAARAVFASGVPLTVVPLDATATLKLEGRNRDAVFNAHTPLTWQVRNLYELWGKETPVLFDPVAVWAAMDDRVLTMRELRLEVDDRGMTLARDGQPNARVAVGIDRDAFLPRFVDRLRSHGAPTLPKPPGNASKLVDPGRFPARVHTFEDYQTDIEKRWWMCGKLETKDVPVPGGRACRAVLTQDFDDKQGDAATVYRAVIFNPVPGPPMGPNTRLRFKYKLAGTDALRVQLYSLSNGYHRYLSVAGLEQGKWLDGCVDMTQMRRPDGTGGPLAADERIDDIQFYVDPRAELLIDDVVLYDAGVSSERRPFPKRVVFTGWFDTGKQGKEWPGDFDIVDHQKPRTWKAARSVAGPDGKPWVRVDLRGERKLDAKTELLFKHRLSETAEVQVELFNRKAGKVIAAHTAKLPKGDWAEAVVPFSPPDGAPVDEIRFRLPSGELLLDDVLLYTPGE